MKRTICTTMALLLAAIGAGAADAAELGYYAQPALHGDRLIFASEGDLWTARLDDGDAIVAHRLTASDGLESRPRVSPDGTRIAFAGEYDGNTDVYVMPVDGGEPRRLTFHPARDLPVGWSADGRRVLLRSPRTQPFGRDELYAVSLAGGTPKRSGFGECTMISHSATGRRFAFTRWSNETWHWKGYRGGTAPEIWIADPEAEMFTQLTDDPASDLFPMWLAGRVYFLSDRSGRANIWSDAPGGGDLRQHTSFAPVPGDPDAVEGYDVRWPNGDVNRGGTRIVFCQGGGLALLDVRDDTVRRLDVRIASDRVPVRTRFARPTGTISEFELSPNGEELLVGTRGELLLFDVDTGYGRQLTRTSGARERAASWMNDEKLLLISDGDGEQQVVIFTLDGSDGPSWVTNDREAWLFAPIASADGMRVAFADKTMRLHEVDMETLSRRQVDRAEGGEITDYRFSPDDNWIAYVKLLPTGFTQIMLYAVRTKRTFPVTDGLGTDREPRWDPAGKYLYYLADRHLDPVMDRLDFNHAFVDTTRVHVVPLAADTPPPLKAMLRGTGFDLAAWASAETKDEPGDAEADGDGDDLDPQPQPEPDAVEHDTPMQVDTEGLPSRAVALPVPPGRYAGLRAVRGGVLYVARPIEGLLGEDWPPGGGFGPGKGTLHRYDLVAGKGETVAEHVDVYALSRDGSAVAYPGTGGIVVKKLAAGAEPKTIDVTSAQLRVDVRGEWRQMLEEAWRLQRDFFWDPDMLGVDWPAMKTKYEALLPRVGTRAELSDVVGEMLGELRTSHTYIFGGERHEREVREPVNVGLLGADLAHEGDGVRISRVLRMPAWAAQTPAPLQPAHLGVSEGDVILAVNGERITPGLNVLLLLQDQAGKHARLTIQSETGERRDVEVVPIPSESELRYLAWIEDTRRAVDEASEGAIGYLHIPDMGGKGLSLFSRQFYPQFTKRAFIIDERDNGGGFVSQMIIERLARRVIARGEPRHGATERYPARAPHAHMVCLIDQHAGSDGDIFPAVFRMLELGPLIGTRTWGGVVGIRGDKSFVDMGMTTQPEFAWWDDRGWSIENRGVAPDVEVVITPNDRLAERDTQLEAAIAHLQEKLAEDDMRLPDPPAYPRREP